MKHSPLPRFVCATFLVTVALSLNALAAPAPEETWPRVQRGDTAVAEGVRPTRGISLGFADGTILFDADRLQPVSCWFGGFVSFSDQPYFGRYWAKAGDEMPDSSWFSPHAFMVQLPGDSEWQTFEPPLESDPNEGSRFDGYEIGESAIRLRYRLACKGTRVGVTEDVRLESHLPWQGMARSFSITGLPKGVRIGLAIAPADNVDYFDADAVPIATYRSSDRSHVIVASGSSGLRWESFDLNRLLTISANGKAEPLLLRLDCWRTRDASPADTLTVDTLTKLQGQTIGLMLNPSTSSKAALPSNLLVEEDTSASKEAKQPRLAALKHSENLETFTPVKTRQLRFVISGTSGGAAGIDEVEVFGPRSDQNLALSGIASASSVIEGFSIHQIAHLNDGILGNEHSWVAGSEKAWLQIDWPEPVEIEKVLWARDRTGNCNDRLATDYKLEVSDADGKWMTVCGSDDHESFNTLQAEDGYVMQSIPMPFDDCRPSDVAFDGNEMMYVIAMTRGEIWRTRMPHGSRPRWERFASGLNHPIGIQVLDGRIFVAQKPEITELVDRNADGVADHYRTVASGWGLSEGFHEYTFGLAADADRNLWFALNTGFFWTNPGYVNPGRYRGSILRVDYGSERLTEVAKGCRVPNGITLGPEGGVFYTDNQGDWIQSCKLAHVIPDRFYGHPETRDDALAEGQFPDGRSAIWLPYSKSRSTSGPAFDSTEGAFGPFAGQLFVGDVGYGGNPGIMRMALEKIGDQWQGACFRFTDGQPLGCERLKFGPDGRLYQASLTSGLTALQFDGSDVMAIHSMKLRAGGTGFDLHFTQPIVKATELAPERFRFRRYHYIYGGTYGSPEDDSQQVEVTGIALSDDRKTITLTLPIETYPIGMVYELTMDPLKATNGRELKHPEAWYTVQRIP
ncbi:MAG: hypothetical protein ACI9DF_003058 [Verrucomicrobiales bacterium]|jgi:hypothetical protein